MAKYSHALLIFVIDLTLTFSQRCPRNGGLAPIVLVPGHGGSRIQAQVNKPAVLHFYCTKYTSEFFNLWLDVKDLLPFVIDCWIDNTKLNYDSFSNKTFNQPGVKTRIPDFGNPEMVEYLDPKSLHLIGGYMNHLTGALMKQGYVRKKNLYAAPYDFRKGPSELDQFFENLEQLVENAYDLNNSSVILVGHSMGAQLTLNFLQTKPQQWKDKYIRAFISLSGPFGGTMKSIKVFAIGDDLGSFILHSEELKEVLITMPSMAYLIPVEELWGHEVLVSTVSKNYTLQNLEEFFNDIGNPAGWRMYLNEKKFAAALSPPGVEVHCFYGVGTETFKRLKFTSDNFHDTPLIEYENGDGTANLRSLEYCRNWTKEQKERVETKSFQGVDHMGTVENKIVLDYIMKTVKELSTC